MFKQKERSTIGAIFCHVIKIILLIQLKPSITIGNQKWKGAIPVFIIKEDAKIILIFELKFNIIFHSIKKENKIIENNRILDARAWVRKYFSDASEENKLFNFIVKGIKDNKLISKPIQTLNQDDELILIIVPKNNVDKNSILYEFFKIKKKRIITFIYRVWT